VRWVRIMLFFVFWLAGWEPRGTKLGHTPAEGQPTLSELALDIDCQ